jgi:hypothetical protein
LFAMQERCVLQVLFLFSLFWPSRPL